MQFDVYTDGSSKGNGQANSNGGWAFCVLTGDKMVQSDSGNQPDTTNQRMELTAAIKSLEWLKSLIKEDDLVLLHSDSAYLINCQKQEWWKRWVENGWVNAKKQPVANQDLWLELIPWFKNERISWEKVKGHSTNTLNNFVDELAQKAAEELK